MTTLPLATSDWRRSTAEEPIVKIQNRFFEKNPTNLVEGSSLIRRPGMREFIKLPSTEVKGLYYNEGIFRNNFFALTTNNVYRIDPFGFPTSINASVALVDISSNDQGAFVAPIGDVPAYFYYLTNSGGLNLSAETAFATGTLTSTGVIEDNAVVQIGGVYYKFTSGAVDTGTPDGTVASPWLVSKTGTELYNLAYAIMAYENGAIQAGSRYSTATKKNPTANVHIANISSTNLTVFANQGGTLGSTVSTTVSATAVLSWGSSTLYRGLSPTTDENRKNQYVMSPDTLTNFKAIASFDSYVVLPSRADVSDAYVGRFYWINPGETYIDPLNFATTEISPDSLVGVRVIGDFLWFIGTQTIEIWYATGDNDLPFQRQKGQSVNIGGIRGSDQAIETELVFVGNDYKVRRLSGNAGTVISDNSIEAQIRTFLDNPDPEDTNLLRSWNFAMDGHLFYVLNLGTTKTLVYDMTTQQWLDWVTYDETYLRPFSAISPLSTNSPFSPVVALPVVGDYETGQLWYIDPEYRYDYNPDDGLDSLIECYFTAGMPARMRETVPCNELYLTCSVGNPSVTDLAFLIDSDGKRLVDSDGAYLVEWSGSFSPIDDVPSGIYLEYSDDNGRTWREVSPIFINENDWTQEICWRSVGLIQAPGRIFRIKDYSTLVRIDGLDIR